jgi:hypothetical protein
MEVSRFRDASAGEQNQAKPRQPDFVTADQRTALPVHAFPYVNNADEMIRVPGVNSALSN